MKLLFPLMLTIVLFCSCKKDKFPSLKDALQYTETHCSDPWADDVKRGNDFLDRLENWLEDKTGAYIGKPYMKFYKEKATQCFACSCTTGNVIYVWPPAGTEQKFLDLGFRKP